MGNKIESFTEFQLNCPWVRLDTEYGTVCIATYDDCNVPGICDEDECGLYYLLKKIKEE